MRAALALALLAATVATSTTGLATCVVAHAVKLDTTTTLAAAGFVDRPAAYGVHNLCFWRE